jgi:hypothetical protein
VLFFVCPLPQLLVGADWVCGHDSCVVSARVVTTVRRFPLNREVLSACLCVPLILPHNAVMRCGVGCAECSVFASCPSGSTRYFLWGGLLILFTPFALVLIYKQLVVQHSLTASADSTARPMGRNRPASVAVDSHHAIAGINFSALTPFSDTGATMKMLARMSDVRSNSRDDGSINHVPVAGAGAAAAAGTASKHPINLRFEKLISAVEVDDGKKKVIMQSVSGTFRAGRVAAVMGPSGAGVYYSSAAGCCWLLLSE